MLPCFLLDQAHIAFLLGLLLVLLVLVFSLLLTCYLALLLQLPPFLDCLHCFLIQLVFNEFYLPRMLFFLKEPVSVHHDVFRNFLQAPVNFQLNLELFSELSTEHQELL